MFIFPKGCYLERFLKQQFLPKPSSNRSKQRTSLTLPCHSNCSVSNLNCGHIGRLWVSARSWHNSPNPFCSLYNENIFLHSVRTEGNSDNNQTTETFTLSGKAMRSAKSSAELGFVAPFFILDSEGSGEVQQMW